MTARTTEPTTAVRRLVAAVSIALLAMGSLSACDFNLSLGGTTGSQTEGGGSGGQGGSGGDGGGPVDGGEYPEEDGMGGEYPEEGTDGGVTDY